MLCFHFPPKQQLLIVSERISDIKDNYTEHFKVILGEVSIFPMTGLVILSLLFFPRPRLLFLSRRRECVFCIFHDRLQIKFTTYYR